MTGACLGSITRFCHTVKDAQLNSARSIAELSGGLCTATSSIHLRKLQNSRRLRAYVLHQECANKATPPAHVRSLRVPHFGALVVFLRFTFLPNQ